MKKSIFFSVIIFFFFQACKKETNQNITGSTPVTLYDYTKPDSGNYWIYQVTTIDSNNNVITSGSDSAYVKNDTLIGANVYKYIPFYIFMSVQNCFRDSSGILVSSSGYSFLKVTGLPDTISIKSSPEYDLYTYCENYPGSYTTPAGTFNNIIKTTNDYYMKPPLDTILNPIRAELFFAKDIGLIHEKYFYFFAALQGWHSERTLSSYYVQ